MQLSVSYQRNGDLHTIHTGGAALGDIVIDNSRVPDPTHRRASKRWPAERWARVLDLLAEDDASLRFLLLRGPEFRAGKPGRPL